jgi:hypothetical protein
MPQSNAASAQPRAMTERLYAGLLRMQSLHPHGVTLNLPDLCALLSVTRSGRTYEMFRDALDEIGAPSAAVKSLAETLGPLSIEILTDDPAGVVRLLPAPAGRKARDQFLTLLMETRSPHARRLLIHLAYKRAAGEPLSLSRAEIEAMTNQAAPLSVARRLLEPAHRELKEKGVIARARISPRKNGYVALYEVS